MLTQAEHMLCVQLICFTNRIRIPEDHEDEACYDAAAQRFSLSLSADLQVRQW